MLKINKIENWYGIKKLNHPELLSGNTVIYSPNGVMKTSFADGIKDLINGEKPRDVFNNLESSYEIEFNGVLYDEKSEMNNFDVLVYGMDTITSDTYKKKDIAELFISTKLKEEYDKAYGSIKDILDEIKNIIVKDICRNDRFNINIFEDVLDISRDTKEVPEIIAFIERINPKNVLSQNVDHIKYNDFFNKKYTEILKDEEFVDKHKIYQQVLNKKKNEKIFNSGFTLERLETVHKSLKTQKYYEAGHKLYIDELIYNEDKTSKLISETMLELYGDEDVKKSYNEAVKIIVKKANQAFISILDNNKWLLEHFDDIKKLKQKYVNTNAINYLEDLKELKKQLKEKAEEIGNVIKKANNEESLWEQVIKEYNERFDNKHYDFKVDNKAECLLGLSVPIIVPILKKNKKTLTDDIIERFSSSEKRAYFILSMIHDIELKKTEKKPFTIILDDIVNSFDYKNKFSMIEYLKELSLESNIQIIILTHNFDFYRSIRIALNPVLTSKLLAYNNAAEEVDLIKGSSKEFEGFQFVQNWKNHKNFKSIISLTPVLRNISELTSGVKNNNDYKELTNFLHYNNNTESKTIGDLIDLFNKFKINEFNDLDRNKYYYKVVKEETEKLLTISIKESKLQEKVLLGIYIRLSTDKMLYEAYKKKKGINPSGIQGSWTRGLYLLVKDDMTDKEKSLYNEAVVVAPTFIHLNSFMYEPLVDIGTLKLQTTCKNLYDYLENKNIS
jgi:hypothetical protein